MICSPRTTLTLSILALLAACTPPAAEEGDAGSESSDTGTTGGDVSSCADPGSEVLPDIKPVLDPTPQGSPVYVCTDGWATDAPWLDPSWTVEIGDPGIAYYNYTIWAEAHPEGGVVVVGGGQLSRYSAAGDQQWAVDVAFSDETQYWLAVEQSGAIVLARYDWMVNVTSIDRYGADGSDMGPLAVSWNNPSASVWGIETFGTDLVFGAYDEDETGNYETTLLRLDAGGNVVLRKSTNLTNAGLLAVNDAGTVLFGNFPTFVVSLDNGAVSGMFAPSNGSASAVVGDGNDFVMTGSSGDLTLGRYSSTGSELWLQAYDRATLSDQGQAVAVGDDGTIVSVGTTTVLNSSNAYWFGTQPIVIASDADGNALWADRMAAHGFASAVAIGTQGEVYVTGIAELEYDPNTQEPMVIRFLRMYQP